jgi:hypothetical protein
MAKDAAEIEALPGGPLAGVPAGPFALVGGGPLPEKTMQNLMKLSMVAIKAGAKDLPEDQAKKLMDIYNESAKKVRGMAFGLGVPKAGDPVFSRAVAVVRVDDADGYLSRQFKATKALNDIFKGAANPVFPPMEVKKVKVANLPALEVTADLTAAINPKFAPELQKQIMEAMFGPGGKMTATSVALDKTTVLVAYVDPAKMKDVVRAAKGQEGIEADPAVAKAAAKLPKGAQWVGYISPKGCVDFALHVAGLIPGGAAPQLPPFPQSSAIGGALKCGPSGVEGELVVTADTLRAIGQYVQTVKGQ